MFCYGEYKEIFIWIDCWDCIICMWIVCYINDLFYEFVLIFCMIFIFSFYIEVIKVVKKILNNIFSGVFVGMVVFWDEILCIRSMYNIIVVLRFCRLKVKLY